MSSNNKHVQTIFLSKKSNFEIEHRVNIILSPEFYWVRVFDIPVKNKKQALKYLPELFADILPEGQYSYYAIKKEQGKFLGFAYDNSLVLKAINNANINNAQIKNVYFAQNELYEHRDFQYLEECFLYTSDDILVRNPFITCEESKTIEPLLKNVTFGKHKMDLKFSSSYVEPKFIYAVSVMFFILMSLNLFKVSLFDNDYNRVDHKMQKIQTQYKMPKTSFETKAILNKMKTEYHQNESFRQALLNIFAYKRVDKNMVFNSINFSNKVFRVNMSNMNTNQFRGYFLKEFKILSQKKQANGVEVELQYVKN